MSSLHRHRAALLHDAHDRRVRVTARLLRQRFTFIATCDQLQAKLCLRGGVTVCFTSMLKKINTLFFAMSVLTFQAGVTPLPYFERIINLNFFKRILIFFLRIFIFSKKNSKLEYSTFYQNLKKSKT